MQETSELLLQVSKDLAVLTEKVDHMTRNIETLNERINKREQEIENIEKLYGLVDGRLTKVETQVKIQFAAIGACVTAIGVPLVTELWKLVSNGGA